MAWVLQNKETQEVWTGSIENNYGLLFHGVKFWDEQDVAAEQAHVFLEQQGIVDTESWQLQEVEEDRLKLFNVRLNNNPSKKLYLRNGGTFEVK